jgi:PhnO protein
MILVRKSLKSDLPALIKLVENLGYPVTDHAQLEITWTKISADPHMGILVAELDKAVVGYLAFSTKMQLRLSGMIMEIDELSISELHRGFGIGSKLISFAKEIAQSHTVKRIIVSTNKDRDSYKRQFYEKNGFIEKNSAFLKIDL